uniref:Uncharacterized protein n=1 Tax=Corvus moneduloides TaxID=1196302 RepID=A0A8C3EQI6_CORMO
VGVHQAGSPAGAHDSLREFLLVRDRAVGRGEIPAGLRDGTAGCSRCYGGLFPAGWGLLPVYQGAVPGVRGGCSCRDGGLLPV